MACALVTKAFTYFRSGRAHAIAASLDSAIMPQAGPTIRTMTQSRAIEAAHSAK